jgi:Ohr subfamily peroxiredoxin
MTTPLEKVLYTAVGTATHGRDGRAKSDDGKLDVALDPPPALGGKGTGTNPEQLFAAGYAACFGSAVSYIARLQKLPLESATVTAHVSIGPIPGGKRFGLAVKLDVDLKGLERDKAEQLMAMAHEACPYSNATRGNIDVTLNLI